MIANRLMLQLLEWSRPMMRKTGFHLFARRHDFQGLLTIISPPRLPIARCSMATHWSSMMQELGLPKVAICMQQERTVSGNCGQRGLSGSQADCSIRKAELIDKR